MWCILLLITAHNPQTFGPLAVKSSKRTYPTLRMLVEMCITNCFVFPPPTLFSLGDKQEDLLSQEMMLAAKDREMILELEEYLAQKPITEQNSLLLSQTMSMDPKGLARRPPINVLEQLNQLNTSHKIGHLLCRSREPDFLLDIIKRQDTRQSMPWLAELVHSHEDSFSMLPVQCLCEFLLAESSQSLDASLRHQQLLLHLSALLCAETVSDGSLEVLQYFLDRLSWQQAGARTQAVRCLQRLLNPSVTDMETEIACDSHTWLNEHLTSLPIFEQVRTIINQAIRESIQVETEPSLVSAYLRYLAVRTRQDDLDELNGLVFDLAQVIVERNTICNAMLPLADRSQHFVHANSTLNAFLVIYIHYMRKVKKIDTGESLPWANDQDRVHVRWNTGEQAVVHILVIHAIVILLTFGPHPSSAERFQELMRAWFPEQLPKAYLVDTSEEALLFPDWLKLRMIRSNVPRLVEAAMKV